MKLTANQETLLDQLSDAYVEEKTARFRIRAEHLRRAEREAALLPLKTNEIIEQCLREGISKRQIGIRGLGTKDPGTVNRRLESMIAPDEYVSDSLSPRAGVYHWDEGTQTLSVTPSLVELAALAPEGHGFTLEAIREDAELRVARFVLEDGALSPVTEDWMPQYEDRHPVMVWLTAEREKEAREWITSKAA